MKTHKEVEVKIMWLAEYITLLKDILTGIYQKQVLQNFRG